MFKNRKVNLSVIYVIFFFIVTIVNGFDFIVSNGKPQADIIISAKAPRSVEYAASELQKYIKEISGANLEIRKAPNNNIKYHIYVGESKFTERLNFTVKDIKYDGFKIVSGPNWLILAGRDSIEPTIPGGYASRADRPRLRKEWQAFTGENWDFPSPNSFKGYNKELKLSRTGKTGTLFAVYDYLESLGIRWYMPYKYGTVIPKTKTITVKPVNIKKEPVFPIRNLFFCRFFMDAEGSAWYKHLKLGNSYVYWCSHSIYLVTRYQKKTHPEYFAKINNVLDLSGCKNYGRPRLGSPELQAAMTKYCRKFFEAYPKMKYFPIFPPDSFSKMDERDIKAGLRTEQRGYAGKMSDYVWGFVNNIAKELEKTNPDKIITCGAYTTYYLPPLKIAKLNPNVGVTLCQRLIDDWNPKNHKLRIDNRRAWLKKLSSGEFYIWDYYLYHRKHKMPGVPVIFPKLIQEDIKALRGVCKGEFIECNKDQQGRVEYPALNHLNYYINAKLYWNPNLDLNALLDEYYEKFYGPAKADMKEFFEFAQEVWMRPESRKISKVGGFMSQKDVDKYFAILNRAKQKAGNTIYGKRIEMLINECQPMKKFFDKLGRSGRMFTAINLKHKPVIDGALVEPTWRIDEKKYRKPYYYMVDLVNGRPYRKSGTRVIMRWLPPQEGLLLGIVCYEPKMEKLQTPVLQKDSMDIFNNDTIEIYIETTQASYYKIVIDSNGNIYDECTDAAIGKGVKWDSQTEATVKKYPDRWTAEIFIPMKNLKGTVPSDTYPWGINVCRARMTTKPIELSALSPTGKRMFLDLQKMGNVRRK